MADKVRINGNLYDYSSTNLKIGDEQIYGYMSVGWGQKRERKLGFGSGRSGEPQGISRGKVAREALKLKLRRDTATQVKKLFAAESADGESYGDRPLPIILQYVEPNSNQDSVQVEFVESYWTNETNSSEIDGDPDAVEVEFTMIRIVETVNGKKLRLYASEE
jgi:hypothetical protein